MQKESGKDVWRSALNLNRLASTSQTRLYRGSLVLPQLLDAVGWRFQASMWDASVLAFRNPSWMLPITHHTRGFFWSLAGHWSVSFVLAHGLAADVLALLQPLDQSCFTAVRGGGWGVMQANPPPPHPPTHVLMHPRRAMQASASPPCYEYQLPTHGAMRTPDPMGFAGVDAADTDIDGATHWEVLQTLLSRRPSTVAGE